MDANIKLPNIFWHNQNNFTISLKESFTIKYTTVNNDKQVSPVSFDFFLSNNYLEIIITPYTYEFVIMVTAIKTALEISAEWLYNLLTPEQQNQINSLPKNNYENLILDIDFEYEFKYIPLKLLIKAPSNNSNYLNLYAIMITVAKFFSTDEQ